MQGDAGGGTAALIVLAAAISCLIAIAAGGTSAWLWGLLGPVGWIVAAVLSVRRTIYEALEVVAPLDETARVEIVLCEACQFQQELFRVRGRAARCSACNSVIDGFSRDRPRVRR